MTDILHVDFSGISASQKLLLGQQLLKRVTDLDGFHAFINCYLIEMHQLPKMVKYELENSFKRHLQFIITRGELKSSGHLFGENKLENMPFESIKSAIDQEVAFNELISLDDMKKLKTFDISFLWPTRRGDQLSENRLAIFQKHLETVIAKRPCDYLSLSLEHPQCKSWFGDSFKRLVETVYENAFKGYLSDLNDESQLLKVLSNQTLCLGSEQHLTYFNEIYLNKLTDVFAGGSIPFEVLVSIYKKPVSNDL